MLSKCSDSNSEAHTTQHALLGICKHAPQHPVDTLDGACASKCHVYHEVHSIDVFGYCAWPLHAWYCPQVLASVVQLEGTL
jgi:hypothetical protein